MNERKSNSIIDTLLCMAIFILLIVGISSLLNDRELKIAIGLNHDQTYDGFSRTFDVDLNLNLSKKDRRSFNYDHDYLAADAEKFLAERKGQITRNDSAELEKIFKDDLNRHNVL
jgi:hypothetical protein